MDYKSLKIKDGNIDTVERKVVLTKAEIEQATARVNEIQNLPVTATRKTSTGNGISFVGPYDVVIGNYTYSEENGKFVLKMNRNALKQYELQKKRAQTKKAIRSFVLKRALPIAGAVVIASNIWAFIQEGKDEVALNPDPEVSVVDVADVNYVPLEKAEIPVILAWADYAMSEYYDTVSNSQYSEHVMPQYDRVYEEHFMPLHSSYERVYEMKMSGLPKEMVGNSIDNNTANVKNHAVELNEDVPKDAKYENTVFSHAIIIDEDMDDKHAQDVAIYVPLAELNTEYSLDNLPDDAIIYNGEVYVLGSHIYDQVKSNSKGH